VTRACVYLDDPRAVTSRCNSLLVTQV